MNWLQKIANPMFPEYWENRYPRADMTVSGLTVSDDIPNTDSIGASLNDWETLPGIREIPVAEFGGPDSVFYAADDNQRGRELAEEIKASGEVKPLIIAVEDGEPWILEGLHRYMALGLIGVETFPALVVVGIE